MINTFVIYIHIVITCDVNTRTSFYNILCVNSSSDSDLFFILLVSPMWTFGTETHCVHALKRIKQILIYCTAVSPGRGDSSVALHQVSSIFFPLKGFGEVFLDAI